MSENNKVSDKTLDYMIHDANLQYLAAGVPDLCSHWQDRIDSLTELKSLRAENERLRQERDDLEAWFDGLTPNEMHESIVRLKARATTAEAKLEEAAKVLEASERSHDAARQNFITMQQAAAVLKGEIDRLRMLIEEHGSAKLIRAARSFLANLKGAE